MSDGAAAGSGSGSDAKVECTLKYSGAEADAEAGDLLENFPSASRAADCYFSGGNSTIQAVYCGFDGDDEVAALRAELVTDAIAKGWEVTSDESYGTALKFNDNSHNLSISGDMAGYGACGDLASAGTVSVNYIDLQAP